MATINVMSLVEVFEAELSQVRFPEVDREVLMAALADVEAAAGEVAAAEARVQAARAGAAAKHEALQKLAARAVAYARVYAEGSPALAAKLDAVAGEERTNAPRKRGRPRKAAVEQVALPEAAQ